MDLLWMSTTCRICFKIFPSVQATLAHEMIAHVKLTEQPNNRKRRRPFKLKLTETEEYKLLREKASDEICKSVNGQEFITLSKVFQPASENLFDVYEMIVEDLQKNLGAEYNIHPFGSAITGLSFKDSDIDFYIEPPIKNKPKKQFEKVFSTIQNSEEFSKGVAIWHARVPIIKCVHKKTGYNLDMNTSSGHGVYNSEFLEKLIKSDPRFQPAILMIRIWAKYRDINKTGGMNSYCLTLMFFFYMQYLEIIPSFKAIQAFAEPVMFDDINFGFNSKAIGQPVDNRSVRSLVEGFFHFYNDFDFENRIICPYLGHAITWEYMKFETNFPQYHEQCMIFKTKLGENPKLPLSIMVVQDPFCLFQNTAKSVSAGLLEKFQKHIQLTTNLIQQCNRISNQWWLIRVLFEVFDSTKDRTEGIPLKNEKKAGNTSGPIPKKGKPQANANDKPQKPKPQAEVKPSQKNSKFTLTLSPLDQELFYVRNHLRNNYPNKVFTMPEIHKFWSDKVVEYIKLMLNDIFVLKVVMISKNSTDSSSEKQSYKAKISSDFDIWTGRHNITKKTSFGNALKEHIETSKSLVESRKKDEGKKFQLRATLEIQVGSNCSVDVVVTDDSGSNSKTLFDYFTANVRILLKGYLEINLVKDGKF